MLPGAPTASPQGVGLGSRTIATSTEKGGVCASRRWSVPATEAARTPSVTCVPGVHTSRAGYRQAEREGRAAADLALHPERADMELDELSGEGESEPRTLGLLVRRADLPEFLEHGFLILKRDPDTGVCDRHFRPIVVQPGGDVDPSPFGRELQRIGDEIQDDLLHLPLVTSEHPEPRVDGAAQPDPASARTFSHQAQRVLDRTRQIEVRRLKLHASRLDLRQVEDVVDEGQQMPPGLENILQILRLLVIDVTEPLLGENF